MARKPQRCKGQGPGEKKQKKARVRPWTRSPTQSSLRACRVPPRPGQAAFSGEGACGTGLGRPASRRNPPTEGYTCVCSSAAGVGGVGGVGGAAARGRGRPRGWGGEGRSPPPGLGTEAKGRASRPCPSPRWLPHGSGLTHTLQDSGGLFHSLLKPVAPWPELPPWMNPSQSLKPPVCDTVAWPGNVESQARMPGGGSAAGSGPHWSGCATAGASDMALPGGGSRGPAGQAGRSLGQRHHPYHSRVGLFPLATRFPTHTSSQGRLPAPQDGSDSAAVTTSCPWGPHCLSSHPWDSLPVDCQLQSIETQEYSALRPDPAPGSRATLDWRPLSGLPQRDPQSVQVKQAILLEGRRTSGALCTAPAWGVSVQVG